MARPRYDLIEMDKPVQTLIVGMRVRSDQGKLFIIVDQISPTKLIIRTGHWYDYAWSAGPLVLPLAMTLFTGLVAAESLAKGELPVAIIEGAFSGYWVTSLVETAQAKLGWVIGPSVFKS